MSIQRQLKVAPAVGRAMSVVRLFGRFRRFVVENGPQPALLVLVNAIDAAAKKRRLAIDGERGRLLLRVAFKLDLDVLDPPTLRSPLGLPLGKGGQTQLDQLDLHLHRRLGGLAVLQHRQLTERQKQFRPDFTGVIGVADLALAELHQSVVEQTAELGRIEFGSRIGQRLELEPMP